MKNYTHGFYISLVLLIVATLPISGMFVTATAVKRFQKSRPNKSVKRNVSFVPSTRYPGYLVCLNRDFTKRELRGSVHTKMQTYNYGTVMIKYCNFTEKEKAFAKNPAYIGLSDSGAVWGQDCSVEKSSWFGSENDYGYFPIALFREADVVAWTQGVIPQPISLEETKKIVLAENPGLKEKYPFLCADEEVAS